MAAGVYSLSLYRQARKSTQHKLSFLGLKESYRTIFKRTLGDIRYAEAQAAEEAAWLASLPPVPDDIQAEVDALRAEAETCRIDGPGNEMYRDLKYRAQCLLDEAQGLL